MWAKEHQLDGDARHAETLPTGRVARELLRTRPSNQGEPIAGALNGALNAMDSEGCDNRSWPEEEGDGAGDLVLRERGGDIFKVQKWVQTRVRPVGRIRGDGPS
jgi:hypothetical protein